MLLRSAKFSRQTNILGITTDRSGLPFKLYSLSSKLHNKTTISLEFSVLLRINNDS